MSIRRMLLTVALGGSFMSSCGCRKVDDGKELSAKEKSAVRNALSSIESYNPDTDSSMEEITRLITKVHEVAVTKMDFKIASQIDEYVSLKKQAIPAEQAEERQLLSGIALGRPMTTTQDRNLRNDLTRDGEQEDPARVEVSKPYMLKARALHQEIDRELE